MPGTRVAALDRSGCVPWIAPRPWLPIGVRVRDEAEYLELSTPGDSPKPEAFVRQLAAIATGMGRNDVDGVGTFALRDLLPHPFAL